MNSIVKTRKERTFVRRWDDTFYQQPNLDDRRWKPEFPSFYDTHILKDRSGLGTTTLAVKGYHATESVLLTLGEFVLGMRRQTWISDSVDH